MLKSKHHFTKEKNTTKLRLLINLSPLKAGGGQNVALNFLKGLDEEQNNFIDFYFLVAKNSKAHKYLLHQSKYAFYVAPSNPMIRIIFERFWFSLILKKNKINIIYSYFGFGYFGKSFKQICGAADSNIYYPEIDFWKEYPIPKQIIFKMVDKYKRWWNKKADAIIFENSALMYRGIELFGLKNAITIKPSIFHSNTSIKYNFPNYVSDVRPRILLLCGWQLNKGIMMVPNIAAELKKNNIKHQFILTAPIDNSPICKQFTKLVKQYDVSDSIYIIGEVEKKYIPDLYKQVDFILLLSKLESFSNNIIEAWTFKVPLIIAKEEWSISICGKAAIYVNRESPIEVASKLSDIFSNDIEVNIALQNAEKELQSYPNISQRIRTELNYVTQIAKIN